MRYAPPKLMIVAALVVMAAVAISLMRRRTPACEAEGKHISSQTECQAFGFAADVCKEAVAKARAAIERAGPKTETMFQCELRFTECFQSSAGGFSPRPSFCLRAESPEPTEIRYLEYEADRRNRKKTKEVRID